MKGGREGRKRWADDVGYSDRWVRVKDWDRSWDRDRDRANEENNYFTVLLCITG